YMDKGVRLKKEDRYLGTLMSLAPDQSDKMPDGGIRFVLDFDAIDYVNQRKHLAEFSSALPVQIAGYAMHKSYRP
ncbi:hypothetical protein D6764_01340, partial [Candidatus Woesearchaeota archaeon]